MRQYTPKIEKSCKVCDKRFLIQPSRAKAFATCSPGCSRLYRTHIARTRKCTWGHKISAALKGREQPAGCRTEAYRQKQREHALRRGLGKNLRGKQLSADHRAKMSAARRGHNNHGWKLSTETRRKMSDRQSGAKSHFWRGGITPKNTLIRSSFEYQEWRRHVFERDNYTCQICAARGVKLHADHIKPFAYFPALRFDLANGRTLCVLCHKQTPTYLSGAKRFKRPQADEGPRRRSRTKISCVRIELEVNSAVGRRFNCGPRSNVETESSNSGGN